MNSKNEPLKQVFIDRAYRFMLYAKRTLFRIAGNLLPGITANLFIKWFNKTLEISQKPLGKKETEFLQTANQMQIKFKDLDLAGYSFGEGPLILLVHGSGGNSANFRRIVPKLVENGFSAMAFDWPNHGNSPCKSFEMKDWEKMIPAVIQQSGQIYGVVTHSAGGPATARALINCPRITNLKKCIFISPHPGGKELLTLFMENLGFSDKVIQRVFQWMENQMNMPMENTYLDKCLSLFQEPNIPDVLTIHDKYDPQIPFSLIESLFARNFDSELYVTEGLGHYKIMHDENVLNKVARFLKG